MPKKITKTETETVLVKKASLPKKKVVKKKTTSTPKIARRAKKSEKVAVSRTLHPEEYFWLVGGGALESLEALADALEMMSDEQFAYHTVRDGNDFSRWIGGVFLDEELARAVSRQKTKEKCAKVLRVYLGM